MQRTMLPAVPATEEQMIAPGYLMKISAHIVFFTPTCIADFVKHLLPYTGHKLSEFYLH